MASLIAVGSTELMYQHLAAIQSYARRVILQGDVLTSDEEEDRGQLMQEFLAVGSGRQLLQTDGEGAGSPDMPGNARAETGLRLP